MNPLFYGKDGIILDYYRVFQLEPGNTEDLLRSRFCDLIKKYHPDSAGREIPKQSEIISVIVNGYRILSDPQLKKEYDCSLFENRLKNSTAVIPFKRIKYTFSFSEVIKTRQENKNKKFSHKELLKKFGQDVEILINKKEAFTGAKAYIELPSRTVCPICSGMDHFCYLCNGIGRINSISVLEVNIPKGILKDEIHNFNLTSIKPDASTNFTMRSISVKISIKSI